MITAIALDDEPPALDILEAYCAQVPQVDLQKSFTRTAAALQYLREHTVDLLFLDINMPSLSGIEFLKKIPQRALVIFTTSYSEYAVESYELNAVDYLLKPYTLDRFRQAVDKAQTARQIIQAPDQLSQDFILLRVDYSQVKVSLADIIFIEGLDNYLKVHLQGRPPLVVRMTMKAIQERLPANAFFRVHRSYIVSLKQVSSLRNKIISIRDEEIPLGNSYEKDFILAFQQPGSPAH